MYLTRKRARDYLAEKGVELGKGGLENMASRGQGPEYAIVRGRALYTHEWLDAWLTEQAKPIRSPRDRLKRPLPIIPAQKPAG